MDPNLQNVSNEIVNASAPASAPAPGKPKSSKGAIATIILLAILAIGGIAGAIYFYMDANNKATENAELSAKLDLIESETGVEVTEKEDEDGNTTTVVEVVNSIPNAEKYIFVNSWNIKIRIPDGLLAVSYIYDASNGSSLSVSGTDCRDGIRCQVIPSFAKILGTDGQVPLGVIVRHDDVNYPDDYMLGKKVGEIDGWSYYYAGPQAVFSTNPEEAEWESDSVNLIREMLTDINNYSKI